MYRIGTVEFGQMKNNVRQSQLSVYRLTLPLVATVLVTILMMVMTNYGYSHNKREPNHVLQNQDPQNQSEPHPKHTAPLRVTVREAKQSKYHDIPIEISGIVLRQTGPQSVLIHDGTAAIEIELSPAQVPPNGLKPNMRLRVRGEISHDGHQNTHEVEATELYWYF